MTDTSSGSKNLICRPNENIIEITNGIVLDTKAVLSNTNTLSVPITDLSLLGTAISSLIPAFRTITQSTEYTTAGLYRVVNVAAGDTLKLTANGDFWGAMKTANGGSKMAQLQPVGTITANTTSVMPFNSFIILMAVALHSVENNSET